MMPHIEQLIAVVGRDNVVSDRDELLAYECDGLTIAKGIPSAVVLPADTDQVVSCLRVLRDQGAQIVPRGSGTGITGACVAYAGGVIVCTSRMRRIALIDTANRVACVEAGVLNDELSDRVAETPGGEHLYFAPDPSSQKASSIGGNAATNAGGLHTLKYGVTTNHILGVELVMPDASVVRTRCATLQDGMGPDLTSLLCGSEGTLGIITRLWVRLSANPQHFRTAVAMFDSPLACSQAVADIIAAGLVPAAMEMIDGAMIRLLEDIYHFGFPDNAGALLVIELDGVEAVLDEQVDRVVTICRNNGAFGVERSGDPNRRAELWSARRKAYGAAGHISRSCCVQDACIPRSTLPEALRRIEEIARRRGIRVTNIFHAGDGNLHPLLLFDEDNPAEVDNMMRAGHEILEYCMTLGGALSGEHGIGVEKLSLMHKMFDEPTMATFRNIKAVFDPDERINAGKKLPSRRTNIDVFRPAALNTPGGAMVG